MSKHADMHFTTREVQILKLQAKHPTISQAEIGRRLGGITRQAVNEHMKNMMDKFMDARAV